MSSGVTLYIYGCQTCGVNAAYIRRCKSKCAGKGIPFEVKNSKYDQQARAEHAEYLMNNSTNTDKYPPIVIHNNTLSTPKAWLA